MKGRKLFIVSLLALGVGACSSTPRNNTSWRTTDDKIKTVYPLTKVSGSEVAEPGSTPEKPAPDKAAGAATTASDTSKAASGH